MLRSLQIITLLFMWWQIFDRILWLQNTRKIKHEVRYKLITSPLAGRKNIVFFKILSHYIIFKRSFITDHSLLKDYNLKVYQKNVWKLWLLKCFKNGNFYCIFYIHAYQVLFWLYISYLRYMFYYIFIIYLYVHYMLFNFFTISVFILFDFKFVW